MTQEQKELLLKDLCARLPYEVIIQHPELFRPSIFVTEKLEEYYKGHFGSDGIDIELVRPYLRPLSSMTKDEEIEWFEDVASTLNPDKQIDFYNKYHFDYRGLIPIGLALEAPENMYK